MIYVLLADGFEELEALTPVDMLRRYGAEVKTAAIDNTDVCGAHSITVKADMNIRDIDKTTIDGIVLPGGMPGTLNLQKDKNVNELIDYCNENKKLIAAICAAPMILGEKGLLSGKSAVCFPGFEENLKGADIGDSPTAVCENYITSKGAGTAYEFGAEIIDYISGIKGEGKKIMVQMQCKI